MTMPGYVLGHAWGGVSYIANVDHRTSITTRRGKISERVGRNRGDGGFETTAGRTTEATPATETTTEATPTAKATAGPGEAPTAAETTTEATAAAKAGAASGESIFTDLKGSTLPLVSVKLRDSITRVVGGLKGDDTGALGATSRVGVYIGADDGALLG